jgi:hypothetical protein
MKLNGGEREEKGAVGATVIARKIPKFGGKLGDVTILHPTKNRKATLQNPILFV